MCENNRRLSQHRGGKGVYYQGCKLEIAKGHKGNNMLSVLSFNPAMLIQSWTAKCGFVVQRTGAVVRVERCAVRLSDSATSQRRSRSCAGDTQVDGWYSLWMDSDTVAVQPVITRIA